MSRNNNVGTEENNGYQANTEEDIENNDENENELDPPTNSERSCDILIDPED